MAIKEILSISLLLCMILNQQLTFPGIQVPENTLIQVRRAHKYSEHQLNLYERNRVSRYTLFLALQNYREILSNLRQIILNNAVNYISGDNNLLIGTGNIVIGSDNKLSGNDNWIMTSKQVTSQKVQNNVLYIGKWRICLDMVSQIQYRPQLAISNMDSMDQDILRNMKNIIDFQMFSFRKVTFPKIR